MVNKLNGVFTKADEESFETFAIYCGLALHHAKVRVDKEFTCHKEHNDIIDRVFLSHIESSISLLAFMSIASFSLVNRFHCSMKHYGLCLKVSVQVTELFLSRCNHPTKSFNTK